MFFARELALGSVMLAKDLSSFGEEVKIKYISKIANISIKETIGTIGLLFFFINEPHF